MTPLGDRLPVRVCGGLTMAGDAFGLLRARASMVGPEVATEEFLAKFAEGFPFDAVRAGLLRALASYCQGVTL